MHSLFHWNVPQQPSDTSSSASIAGFPTVGKLSILTSLLALMGWGAACDSGDQGDPSILPGTLDGGAVDASGVDSNPAADTAPGQSEDTTGQGTSDDSSADPRQDTGGGGKMDTRRAKRDTGPDYPPSAPTQMQVEAISSNQVRVTWIDTSNNEAGFRISYATDKSAPGTIVRKRVGADVTRATISGLDPKSTYWVRLAAHNAAGTSVETDWKRVQTLSAQTEKTFLASVDNSVRFACSNDGTKNKTYNTSALAVGCGYTKSGMFEDCLCSGSALKFDLSGALSGKTVRKATLKLTPQTLPGDQTNSFYVKAYAGSWNETSLTYANQPRTYASSRTSFRAPRTSLPVVVDVTSIVRNWTSGSWANNGLYLGYDIPASHPGRVSYQFVEFKSREVGGDPSLRPKLTVRYE